MNTLYLECASGISGDMFAAAMLDLGANEAGLRAVLQSLGLEELEFRIARTAKNGISATDFTVINRHEEEHACHHHDHAHEHGHEHGHHHDHEHYHEHRNLAQITEILKRSSLSARALKLAEKIFRFVAEAEAKVHGRPVEEVHFHEVGAWDSIADIAAAAFCADDLDVGEVVVPRICEGTGFVHCQHGDLPVPVPATAEILRRAGIPLQITDEYGEMATPTGAAIAAALRTQAQLPERFTILKTGFGAGKKEFHRPNLLRAMLIRPDAPAGTASALPGDEITLLETNIDDATGEALGLAMDHLLAAGAKDVHYIPAFMKKNRPGWLLRVLCDEALRPALERIVFEDTTAIGLRRQSLRRSCLDREVRPVELACGTVQVKVCRMEGRAFYYPEYESVRSLAGATGIPFAELYRAAAEAAAGK